MKQKPNNLTSTLISINFTIVYISPIYEQTIWIFNLEHYHLLNDLKHNQSLFGYDKTLIVAIFASKWWRCWRLVSLYFSIETIYIILSNFALLFYFRIYSIYYHLGLDCWFSLNAIKSVELINCYLILNWKDC